MADYIDILDNIELYELMVYPRPERVIRDRLNPFETFDDNTFLNRFRLPKPIVLDLLGQICDNHEMEGLYQRQTAISPMNQLLVCLHFYGNSSFLRTNGDIFGIHKTTASRIVRKCSRALASLRANYIKFPEDQETLAVNRGFYDIGGMPEIIGCIDCTHVPIISPGKETAELFRNRKGFFSINVQAICDADLIFRNVVARWPGSTHDSRIFENSKIGQKFERHEINGLLLGDNGYPSKQYLLTPLLTPKNDAERRFNYVHCKTRVKIENAFEVLKRRFPCLALQLRLKLDTALAVIVACAILHNIARSRHVPELNDVEVHDQEIPVDDARRDGVGAMAQRNRIIQILEENR